MFDDIPKTKEDVVLRAKLEKRARELEMEPKVINGASVETLKSLIEADEWERKKEVKQQKAEIKKAEPSANDMIKKASSRAKKVSVVQAT
jgi:predicted nuclease of restriction endonuclease-like (RecB) superfamily